MTLSWFLSLTALGWWSCSTAVLLLSFVAALLHPLRRGGAGFANCQAGLTAVVPVKDLHFGFAEAQQSLFSQDYEQLEVLVSSAESHSPALSRASEIQRRFPHVPSRTVVSHCRSAASPKLNNMWPAICHAENDLVLTKDSNVVLHPGDIAAFVGCLGADVGLVSAIPIATDPMTFAAWIEASIINCYHARVLMLGDAVGLGFGLGKIMLFRRSDLTRAGGFDCLKWALGEDMAIARALRQSGLPTVLSRRVCHQTLGRRSLNEVWQRQLRWMTIWRVQLPAAFLAAFLGSAIPTGIAGSVGAPLIGLSPAAALAGTLIAWFGIEFILCVAKGWPISFWSPLAFLAREIFTTALWLCTWMTSEVSWAGTKYHVRRREAPPAPKRANGCDFPAREKSE